MGVVTWGQLAKSADDPEKIEEAIQRMIDEHKADSTAHTGAGEALDEHRKNEVIDHPAGSIVPDKITNNDYIVRTLFESLSGMSTRGDVSNDEFPGARLYLEDGYIDVSGVNFYVSSPAPAFHKNKYMSFEAGFDVDFYGTTYYLILGVGVYNYGEHDGFGFKITNGQLKGYVRIASSFIETSNIQAVGSSPFRVRAVYFAQTQKVYFYVNGSKVAELDASSNNWDSDTNVGARVERGSESDGNLWLHDLMFSTQYDF